MESLEKILRALKGKAEIQDFELFYQETKEQPVQFEQGVLQNLESKTERGVGLRVISNGKIGFTSSSDFSDPEAIVQAALSAARFGPEAIVEFPDEYTPAELEFRESSWPTQQRVNQGKETVKRFADVNPNLSVHFAASEIRVFKRIVNSKGLDISFSKPLFLFYTYVAGMTETGYLADGDYRYMTRVPDVEPVVDELLQRVKMAGKAVEFSSGRKTVVFAPSVSNLMISSLQQALSGKSVAKGISPMRESLNQGVMGPAITIEENPHHPWLAGSEPFDDEGVQTKPRTIVENGVLRSFNLDLWSAAKLGMQPTGSAQRQSYKSTPGPEFSNVIMRGGERSMEEIVASLDQAVIVYGTIGGGQSNMLAGDFSFNVGMGLAVIKGEIAGRVKDVMISGNFFKDSHNILEMSTAREKRVALCGV